MRLVAVCLLAMGCAGYASVTRGWDEQIAVSSTPSGVEAIVSGPSEPPPCVTPFVIKVKRNDEISIAFRKDGYEPQTITLTKEVASHGAVGFAGNLLVGGVGGMLVDGFSGARLDHQPNPVIVTMQPIAPPRVVKRKPPARPVS